ncbi:MAG: GIY-YIG nuclease family protein [Roseibacillus sp.]
MAVVYILKGQSGRYYIGATENFEQRLKKHQSGGVHSTKRLGLPLEVVVTKEFSTKVEAFAVEKKLKSWKNPGKAITCLEG